MSEAATAEHPTQQQPVKGRKDKEGQTKQIDVSELQQRVDGLVELKHAADSAADEYDEAIVEAAEASGLLASVVRKFVGARAGKSYEEKRRVSAQLELCFNDIGNAEPQ